MEAWKSAHQRFSNNLNKCAICFCQYNTKQKEPVIICTMHHTLCRECLGALGANKKCPFCRENIDQSKVVINQYVFQLLIPELSQPKKEIKNKPFDRRLQENMKNLLPPYFFLLFVFSVVSIIINFYIHFAGTDSQCLDENNEGFILRHWLFVIGAIKISLILLFFLQLIIQLQWRKSIANVVFYSYLCLMFINIYACIFIQIVLFWSVITPYCKDGIYAYGVYLIVANCIQIIYSIIVEIRFFTMIIK